MSKWQGVYLILCASITIGLPLACLVAINIITRRKKTVMSSKAGDWVCEPCKSEGKDFRVPAGDAIAVEIMRGHLKDEHGIRPPNTIRREL